MRYTLIIFLALSFTLQAEDAKQPQIPEVQSAMAALEKSIVAARKVYDPIVTKAVGDAVLKLNLVKSDYMKKNDLEGANMIVEAIAKLKEGSVVGEIEGNVKSINNMKLFAGNGLIGTWEASVSATSWHGPVVVFDNMKASCNGCLGDVTVNQENNSFTIKFSSGYKHSELTWKAYGKSLSGSCLRSNDTSEGKIIYTRISAK